MPTPAAALRAMAEQTDDEEMQRALELSRQSSEMKTSSYIPSQENEEAASPAGGHNNAVQTLVDMFGRQTCRRPPTRPSRPCSAWGTPRGTWTGLHRC